MIVKEFHNKIIECIDLIEQKETTPIKKAAKVLFDTFLKDGIVHIFATGHSHMFAEELFYRAGGLVPIDPVLVPILMQHEGPIRSTKMERLTGLAQNIYDSIDKKEDEPFIIVSNSGINCVPVEMAELAKKDGRTVIAVTSVKASFSSTPRTISQKRLCEVADIIIDNHIPMGDGVIESEYGKIGAASSIIGSYIAQSLVLEVINLYQEKGMIPPIYQSANTIGGDEHNKHLYEKYQKRIRMLY